MVGQKQCLIVCLAGLLSLADWNRHWSPQLCGRVTPHNGADVVYNRPLEDVCSKGRFSNAGVTGT